MQPLVSLSHSGCSWAHDQQCVTSDLRSWYWHFVSLVNPWLILNMGSAFSYWSSSVQQPANHFNRSVVSDRVCDCFLCPWKSSFIHLLSWISSVGGGIRLWLQLLISPVFVVCCDNVLLHQQSYGCLTPVLPHFDPPQCPTAGMWKHNARYLFPSSWMKQQEAEPNILVEFGRVHILAWKQSFSSYSTGYLSVLKSIEFSFLKKLMSWKVF